MPPQADVTKLRALRSLDVSLSELEENRCVRIHICSIYVYYVWYICMYPPP